MASFDQDLNTLKTATDYPSVSQALRGLLDACPANQVDNFKLKVAAILREKQAAEGRMAQKHPKALQEIDLKYKNLVNILASHSSESTPQTSPAVNKANPITKSGGGLGGIGSMIFKNFFQSKKKMIVGFGVGFGAVASLAFLYNKFAKNSNESQKNPQDFKTNQLEGFEKTLAALQRLRSLNKISKTGSFDDYEGYLTGKKKKGDSSKEIKKLIDWNKEENSLVSSADKAMKALANFKLSQPELPLLSDSGSLPEFSFEESKKKRKRREKKEDSEITEESSLPEELAESELDQEESVQESAAVDVETDGGRLIPVVKRNKRIKKIF